MSRDTDTNRPQDEAWYRDAACRGLTPYESDTVFFPLSENEKAAQIAKDLFCRRCPVRQECLSSALLRAEPTGIWAGTTTTVRNRLKRRRSRIKCPACLCYEMASVPDTNMLGDPVVYNVCVSCGVSWTREDLEMLTEKEEAGEGPAELEEAA